MSTEGGEVNERTWGDAPLERSIVALLESEYHITKMTAIQRLAVPAVLEGKNLIACAQTGSGKTLAFMVPICQMLLSRSESGCVCVKCVCLSPTREIASQTQKLASRICENRLSTASIFGGCKHQAQTARVEKGLDILTGCPGRLLDIIESLPHRFAVVAHVVIDEADRMLGVGFVEDVQRIIFRLMDLHEDRQHACIRPDFHLKNFKRAMFHQSTPPPPPIIDYHGNSEDSYETLYHELERSVTAQHNSYFRRGDCKRIIETPCNNQKNYHNGDPHDLMGWVGNDSLPQLRQYVSAPLKRIGTRPQMRPQFPRLPQLREPDTSASTDTWRTVAGDGGGAAPFQLLLFAANMPPYVQRIVKSEWGIPNCLTINVMDGGNVVYDSDNVEHQAFLIGNAKKLDLLRHILPTLPRSGLIFTRTKARANRVCEQLQRDGMFVQRIHGNRSQAARTRALRDFLTHGCNWLIATDVAGRGIEVHGVPCVVNFDLPINTNDYFHRIGRTGGLETRGLSCLFVDPDMTPKLNPESGGIQRFTDVELLAKITEKVGRPIDTITLSDFDYKSEPRSIITVGSPLQWCEN